jgi:hypothetical protein
MSMGYKHHNDSIYVVQWPNFLTKVGVTYCKRWKKFVFNGAEIVGVWEVNDKNNAYSAETLVQNEVFHAYGKLAIDYHDADYLKTYLGKDNGGFTEVFYMPQTLTANDLRQLIEATLDDSEHCYSRMLPKHANPPYTDIQTDKQTNKQGS